MKLIDVRMVYHGDYLSYYEAIYELEDGRRKVYEFVSRKGSFKSKEPTLTVETLGKELEPTAVIMLVFSEDKEKVLLCREFRLSANDWVYNNPAGLIDPGETMEQAARRELREETGLELVSLGYVWPPAYSMPGMTDDATQMITCYARGDIKPSDSPLEQNECFWADKEQVIAMVQDPSNHFSGRTQVVLTMWAMGI